MLSLVVIFSSLFIFSQDNSPKEWLQWKTDTISYYQNKLSAPTATHHIYISQTAASVFLDLSGSYPRFNKTCKNCEIKITTSKDKKVLLSDQKFKTSVDLKPKAETPIPKRDQLFIEVTPIEDKKEYRLFVHDLSQKNLAQKRQRSFFSYNPDLKLKAQYKKTKKPQKEIIQRSDGSTKEADVFGTLSFKMNKKDQIISLYDLSGSPAFKESPMALVIFRDFSNGKRTYGAGRFLTLDFGKKISELKDNDTVTLDFNYSYNPPCAVSTAFHCPLPKDTVNAELLVGESYQKL